mmetsp:Transcript_18475/g.32600  ORF Transcript_18475/g.32600 Transcript_18475/m.32600 type:complete len:162 (+) Transcript_18475:172-657(+)
MPSDDSTTKKSVMQKLLAVNSKPTPETFPELPDCVIWIRFVLALGYGFFVAFQQNSRGAVNLLFAINLVTFIPVVYANTYLGANQEAYGTKLLFGGAMQGIGLVLLIWIYFYTEAHAEDEAAFVSAYEKLAANSMTEDILSGSAGDVSDEAGGSLTEESEF